MEVSHPRSLPSSPTPWSRPSGSAKIDVDGSTVLIAPETMNAIPRRGTRPRPRQPELDTAREMKVLIGCITVSPITSDRTQYEVTDINGRVRVVATKNDVKIHCTARSRDRNRAHLPTSSYAKASRQPEASTAALPFSLPRGSMEMAPLWTAVWHGAWVWWPQASLPALGSATGRSGQPIQTLELIFSCRCAGDRCRHSCKHDSRAGVPFAIRRRFGRVTP